MKQVSPSPADPRPSARPHCPPSAYTQAYSEIQQLHHWLSQLLQILAPRKREVISLLIWIAPSYPLQTHILRRQKWTQSLLCNFPLLYGNMVGQAYSDFSLSHTWIRWYPIIYSPQFKAFSVLPSKGPLLLVMSVCLHYLIGVCLSH